jgi:hypothetical protein
VLFKKIAKYFGGLILGGTFKESIPMIGMQCTFKVILEQATGYLQGAACFIMLDLTDADMEGVHQSKNQDNNG